MSITSRGIAVAALALALAACLPGPWDYTPSGKPVFRGIWVSAYAVADRPAENVCLERLLGLNEAYTDAFPFYDSAEIAIEGVFEPGGQSARLRLTPQSSTPNCFSGDTALLFRRGETYRFEARVVWDSAGTRVATELRAVARVPREFSVDDSAAAPSIVLTGLAFDGNLFAPENFQQNLARLPERPREQLIREYGDTLIKLSADSAALNAYLAKEGPKIFARMVELLKQDQVKYGSGDTLFYLGGEAVINNLSHYFHSRRSDDVNGVLITHRYDTNASKPVTSFDNLRERLGGRLDTGDFYYPGDRRRLVLYPSTRSPSGHNVLDSMGVVNAWFFTRLNRLYFYGVEKVYTDFQFSNTQEPAGGPADQNPKLKPYTNVAGGRGFFAGMVLDSFDVHIKVDSATRDFPYPAARSQACRKQGWFASRDCAGYYREFCAGDGWEREDCRLDAIYTCADSAGRASAPPGLCEAAEGYAREDSLLALEAMRRYCIDQDYPGEVPACAAVRRECETGTNGNGCHLVLWKACELVYWKLPACVEGRRSYCETRSGVHTALCRDATEF